jgi:hypothetical protein
MEGSKGPTEHVSLNPYVHGLDATRLVDVIHKKGVFPLILAGNLFSQRMTSST